MGSDVDELLAYQTPKVVVIKDRMLGMIKYTFMFIIFLYVFVWQLAYKGAHLQLDQLSGVARVQLQHPTKRCNPMDIGCEANFSSLEKLPYCNRYTGVNASAVQRECRFFDALDLLIPMDAGYLVPSFIETYDQLAACTPNATNGFKCDSKYEFADKDGNTQKGTGRAKPFGQYFVADVEHFTLLVDHSFRVETGAVEYDDYKMQGYWRDCRAKAEKTDSLIGVEKQLLINSTLLPSEDECEKKPIVCAHKDCKRLGMVTALQTSEEVKAPSDGGDNKVAAILRNAMSKSRSAVTDSMSGRLALDTVEAAEEEEEEAGIVDSQNRLRAADVYSLKSGDVFSISTLYAMAGRKLDDWWFDNSSKVNKTTRQRGTVLVVDIHYNNLKPWTFFTPQNPPEYEISVTSRPVEKYKYMQAIEGTGKNRQLKVAYGTLVIVQSSGTIGVFRMIHMLIVLSTSLGLLAVASVMTDLLAIYVLPLKEEYGKAKYQDTADFHELYAQREAGATAYY